MRKKLISLCVLSTLSSVYSVAQAYYTQNGKIYDKSSQEVLINGVNWAGFQDSGFVDELYRSVPFYSLTGKSDLGVMDMLINPDKFSSETGITKENAVSFKTIRLPIKPQNIVDDEENTHFRLDLVDPKNPQAGNGVFCAKFKGENCQTGLSTKESLYKLIGEFQKHNVNVLLDIHQTDQGRNGNVQPLNTDKNYLNTLLQQLLQRQLNNVVGIDVFNEPHNLDWYKAEGDQPAWVQYIAEVAEVVYQNSPNLLMFVEGTSGPGDDATPICMTKLPPDVGKSDWATINSSYHCENGGKALMFKSVWGEDFKALLTTDKSGSADGNNLRFDIEKFRAAISKYSSPQVADWLLGKPDDKQAKAHLVFSPHVYGKHVATWQTNEKESPYRFDANWGFILKSGYPIVIGETGYDPAYQTDVDFFKKSLEPYLQKYDITHNVLFWAFNSNSGDTGGIRDKKSDTKLVLQKEKDLHELFSQHS